MAPTPQSPEPEKSLTAEDVEMAERRVAAARERAAHAGLSAAASFARSADMQDDVARIEEVTVARTPHADAHRESIGIHRRAAEEDRVMAERKRRESEADLRPPQSGDTAQS
jgi:hypothetical protein